MAVFFVDTLYIVGDDESVACVMQDLRGVQQDAVSGDESWHQLTCVLHHLVTVTSLLIGSCPASIVHAVADQMFWLRHFSAENVADLDRFNVFCCCCDILSCCIEVLFAEIS